MILVSLDTVDCLRQEQSSNNFALPTQNEHIKYVIMEDRSRQVLLFFYDLEKRRKQSI